MLAKDQFPFQIWLRFVSFIQTLAAQNVIVKCRIETIFHIIYLLFVLSMWFLNVLKLLFVIFNKLLEWWNLKLLILSQYSSKLILIHCSNYLLQGFRINEFMWTLTLNNSLTPSHCRFWFYKSENSLTWKSTLLNKQNHFVAQILLDDLVLEWFNVWETKNMIVNAKSFN